MDEELAQDIMTEYYSKYIDNKLQYIKNGNCRFFFEPFDRDAVTIDSCMLRCFPVNYTPNDVYMGSLYVQFDIIVHMSISKTKTGRRRNLIAKEIINSLNGIQLDSTIQPFALIDRPLTLTQFNGDYWGYSLIFRTAIATKGAVC